MRATENRNIVINRIRKEIIGPGSDIFQCKEDYSDEIIEGKPLQRYFSGILFPKQLQPNASYNGEQEMNDEDAEDTLDLSLDNVEAESKEKEIFEDEEDEIDKTSTQPKYSGNTFFPSHFALTFAVDISCKRFKAVVSFGNYKKASHSEIKIPYNGEGVHLLAECGLSHFVNYDEENKALIQTQKLQRTKTEI